MEPEVNGPTPELVKQLKTRSQLTASVKKLKNEFAGASGNQRRRVDMQIEGLEGRLRSTASFIGSALKTEGFPPDYELPEDDDNETNLVSA